MTVDAPFIQRLTPEFFGRVQHRIAECMRDVGIDILISDHAEDVAYVTGFFHHPGERPVVVAIASDGEVWLLLPALESAHAKSQNARATLLEYFEYPGATSPFEPLRTIVGAGGEIAVNRTMSLQKQSMLVGAIGKPAAASNLLEIVRAVKFDEELLLHREAARITDEMLTQGVAFVRERLHSGELPTEEELERFVASVGSAIIADEHEDVVRAGFTAGGLVYGGANSSFPHAPPADRRLREGESFMLSLGAAVGGRFVEGERTFFLGDPSNRQVENYESVGLAQQAGHEAIQVGTPCSEANDITLGVLRSRGLSAYILHRQGHGIGLGMHEPPWLESGDGTLLESGMVVSNEPGIYVPDHAGYRISDTTLVRDEGAERLTKFGHSLDTAVID